jgi:hypothetical protein
VRLLVLFAVVSNILVEKNPLPAFYHVMPSSPLMLRKVFIAAPKRLLLEINHDTAYCPMICIPFNPCRSPHSFRFGSDVQSSHGTMPIRILAANSICQPARLNVVNIDIPVILGLEF